MSPQVQAIPPYYHMFPLCSMLLHLFVCPFIHAPFLCPPLDGVPLHAYVVHPSLLLHSVQLPVLYGSYVS